MVEDMADDMVYTLFLKKKTSIKRRLLSKESTFIFMDYLSSFFNTCFHKDLQYLPFAAMSPTTIRNISKKIKLSDGRYVNIIDMIKMLNSKRQMF